MDYLTSYSHWRTTLLVTHIGGLPYKSLTLADYPTSHLHWQTTLLVTRIGRLPWGDRALPILQLKYPHVQAHRSSHSQAIPRMPNTRLLLGMGPLRTKLTVSAFRYQKDLTTLHAVLWDNGAKFTFSQVNLAAQYQLLCRGSTGPLRIQTNGKFNGFLKFLITTRTAAGLTTEALHKPRTYAGDTLREIIRYACSVYGILYTVLSQYY